VFGWGTKTLSIKPRAAADKRLRNGLAGIVDERLLQSAKLTTMAFVEAFSVGRRTASKGLT
jgi:hypothetical protein